MIPNPGSRFDLGDIQALRLHRAQFGLEPNDDSTNSKQYWRNRQDGIIASEPISENKTSQEVKLLERFVYAWGQQIRLIDRPARQAGGGRPKSADFEWNNAGWVDIEVKSAGANSTNMRNVRKRIRDKIIDTLYAVRPITNFVVDFGEYVIAPDGAVWSLSFFNADNQGHKANQIWIADALGLRPVVQRNR